MRRFPRIVRLNHWVLAAVTTMLSLLIAVPTPASADSVTSVGQCPSGDRSYSSVHGTSAGVRAPEGHRITSFCVVGRGHAGPEVHTLSTPEVTVVVRHSSGKQLASYTVTYVQIPVPSESGSEPAAERTAGAVDQAKPELMPVEEASETTPSRSADAEKSAVEAGSDPSSRPTGDGEELQITRFDEQEERIDRRTLVVVGGIIVVGLLAGATALTVKFPGQR